MSKAFDLIEVNVSAQDLSAPGCYVLADIGGTNARFAFVTTGDATLQCVHSYACSEYGRFEDALHAYIERLAQNAAPKPIGVCLAVAAAVHNDLIKMTNSPWQFSRSALSQLLSLPITTLNDFSAQAYCLADLEPAQVQWWQQAAPSLAVAAPARHALSIVGPGTGFGGATLLPSGEILESEPGHVSFAPVNPHEAALLAGLWQRYPRISVEHLLSGPGLANLYWANAQLQGIQGELHAADVVAGAEQGDALCLRSIADFTGIMGSVCGDIALATGSLSGLYLSGAMLAKMDKILDRRLFMMRFTDKGPFATWCSEVPVGHISADYPGLLGCAAYCRSVHV
jgi:glucokinase